MLGDQFVVFFVNIDLKNDSISAMANLFFMRDWEYLLLAETERNVVFEVGSAKLPLLLEKVVEEISIDRERKIISTALERQILILEAPVLHEVFDHRTFPNE